MSGLMLWEPNIFIFCVLLTALFSSSFHLTSSPFIQVPMPMIRFRLFQGGKQTLQEKETKAIRDILVGILISDSNLGSGDPAYYF
jgi:hypothetical protein